MEAEDETITIDGVSYRIADQVDEFQKLAPHLKHARRMLIKRHKDIAVLTLARDNLRRQLLMLLGETINPDEDIVLPDTISFEDAD